MPARCQSAIDHSRESAVDAPRPAIRRSRAGRWRAWVLIAIYVAVALHVAHWWRTGSTLSPLEPSESIAFSKRGIVNAGTIFFALTILSTLVFGRWFCGWACHVVALQDLCRWMLIKVGLRPRPVQLGVLGAVPWLVFAYMFLAPLLQRVLHGDDLSPRALAVTTTTFWATFPGWVMAIATFAVCGFAIVWFLGAKGFCTYGCPYGAIFGVVDQLAPVRIRVTDACEGCGHCTAVCSSNVRVHQEVRDWGMVVDAGCMKCLDCVSVCPKDALYVGAGTPALFAKPRRELAQPKVGALERYGRIAVLAGFVFATLWVLLDFNADHDGRLMLALGSLSLVVAFLFRGKARRAVEYSLAEELVLAAVFLGALYAYRGFQPFGSRDGFPLLCALGMSAITAYLVVQLLRTAARANVTLQRLELRRNGRLTGAGALFIAAMVGVLAFGARGAAAQHARRARLDQNQHARELYTSGVERAQRNDIDGAIADFEQALALDGEFLEARENLAGMLCAAGRYEEGVGHYLEALRVHPDDADTHALLGQAYLALQQNPKAEEQFEAALRLVPDHAGAHLGLSQVCALRGDAAGAQRHREAARRAVVPSRP
jgi:tetratricopeptide (TPR) repeat protein/NAD-dependent dihydropyrimidine dehydrogenase PreA subunit